MLIGTWTRDFYSLKKVEQNPLYTKVGLDFIILSPKRTERLNSF